MRQPQIDLHRLLTDVRELVETESPSTDLDAVAGSAEVVARLGAAHLGAPPERLVVDGVTHLRWRFGSGPHVLLLGHHDTVWPHGTLDRIPYAVTDGVLRGPGCFDMLAGLVMAFHAVAALPSPEGICLLVTGDEEVGSPTSRALIEAEAREASAVLVLEASVGDGALKTARKGTSMYEVEVVGRAAHAGLEPDKGINVTVELAHQVPAVAALASPSAGTTVTPTSASAGTTLNTVPAVARFTVDVRAWSATEQERVDAGMRALEPVLEGAKLVVHGGINRPPLEESMSAALFERAVAVATRHGLPVPGQAAVGGASDGNFAAGVGTPTLDGLGAVGGGAHAEDEHVRVDRLVDRTLLLHGLLEDLVAAGSAEGSRSRP